MTFQRKRKAIFMIIQHGLMKEGRSGAPKYFSPKERTEQDRNKLSTHAKGGIVAARRRTMTCIKNTSSPRENHGEQKIPSLLVLPFRINGKTNMLSGTGLEALPFLYHYPQNV